MEFKGTQGKWIVSNRNTNGTNGFEIQYGTDGECVTDHVYTIEDAKLISKAPEMLEMLINLLSELKQNKDAIFELMEHQDGWDSDYERLDGKIEKLEQLIEEATKID